MRKKAAFISLSGILMAASACNAGQETTLRPFFTAPYSGEKVHEYSVTLPLSRREKQTFSIPKDCVKLNSRLLEGSGRWGNRIERRLWMKADDDCRYLNYLKKNSTPATHDFVSQYDFYNARIADLPIRPGCDLQLLLENPKACPPPMPGMPNFSMMMHEHFGHAMQPDRWQDCAFQNGIIRGYIHHTGNGLRCLTDKNAPGYRILSVDFADVNGDGWQDAVLRLNTIGRGSRPNLLVLPLTRFAENEPFSIPEGSDYPRLGPAKD